jgi:hypothetical protein
MKFTFPSFRRHCILSALLFVITFRSSFAHAVEKKILLNITSKLSNVQNTKSDETRSVLHVKYGQSASIQSESFIVELEPIDTNDRSVKLDCIVSQMIAGKKTLISKPGIQVALGEKAYITESARNGDGSETKLELEITPMGLMENK